MANNDNIFKNSLSDAELVTPEVWSERIEQEARERAIFRNMPESVVIYDQTGKPGNTMHVTKNSALTASSVSDGDSLEIETPSFSQVDISAGIVGKGVQFTLKQLRDQLNSVRQDVIDNLATAIAEREDEDIISELYETSSTVLYANDTDSGSISDSDTFDVTLFNKGVTKMRIDNRDAKNLVVHPKQEGDLRELSQFTDASQFGDRSVVATGSIGKFLGVNVYSSTRIQTDDSDNVTTYKALLLGRRAVALMDKKRPTVEMDRGLIQDMSMTFTAYADYGVKMLNDESCRVLKSA